MSYQAFYYIKSIEVYRGLRGIFHCMKKLTWEIYPKCITFSLKCNEKMIFVIKYNGKVSFQVGGNVISLHHTDSHYSLDAFTIQ